MQMAQYPRILHKPRSKSISPDISIDVNSNNSMDLVPRRQSSLISQSLEKRECDTIQFFKVFFNFSYYLLLLPFRFSFDPQTGLYELHTNRFQLILLWLNKLLTGAYFFLKLWTLITIKLQNDPNPAVYMEIAYYICDTLYLSLMFYLFGRKSHEVKSIFNAISMKTHSSQGQDSEESYAAKKGYRKTTITATLICISCIGSAYCCILEAFCSSKWNFNSLYLHYETDGRSVFSRLYNFESSDSLPWLMSGILAFTSFWGTVTERFLNAFSDILFTMLALTFRSIVKSFLQLAKAKFGTVSPERVIKSYQRVKSLTEQMNATMSLITASFIVGNLPFYVTNVFDIFSNTNYFLKIRYLFYCSFYFPSLFLAAHSCREMEEMKVWTAQVENVRTIPSLDLSLLLHQVNNQPIALGSFGCLHVNFSLVGSEISIILTYALQKSQFLAKPMHDI